MEIRNFKLQCVPPGGNLFVAESGYGEKGNPLSKLMAQVTFSGNIELTETTFNDHFDLHQVSTPTLRKMLENWKRKVIVGIQFTDVQPCKDTMYIQSRGEAARVLARGNTNVLCPGLSRLRSCFVVPVVRGMQV